MLSSLKLAWHLDDGTKLMTRYWDTLIGLVFLCFDDICDTASDRKNWDWTWLLSMPAAQTRPLAERSVFTSFVRSSWNKNNFFFDILFPFPRPQTSTLQLNVPFLNLVFLSFWDPKSKYPNKSDYIRNILSYTHSTGCPKQVYASGKQIFMLF